MEIANIANCHDSCNPLFFMLMQVDKTTLHSYNKNIIIESITNKKNSIIPLFLFSWYFEEELFLLCGLRFTRPFTRSCTLINAPFHGHPTALFYAPNTTIDDPTPKASNLLFYFLSVVCVSMLLPLKFTRTFHLVALLVSLKKKKSEKKNIEIGFAAFLPRRIEDKIRCQVDNFFKGTRQSKKKITNLEKCYKMIYKTM